MTTKKTPPGKTGSFHDEKNPSKKTNGFLEEWVDCWNCGGTGFFGHNCGEDTCCCLFPDDNEICDVCDGNGGWYSQDAHIFEEGDE